MCGIIGYIGYRKAIPILLNGLKRLEYRGYDSCGIALIDNNSIKLIKTKGSLENLKNKLSLESRVINSTIGIAHTRWATHGIPNEINAHPHISNDNSIAIVHNGIIENFESLKKYLIKEGYVFKSQTDSEVIVHLISKFYKGDLKEAVQKALQQIVGTFGLLVLNKSKDELIVARRGAPVVIGLGNNEYFVSSDVSGIIEYTKNVKIGRAHV